MGLLDVEGISKRFGGLAALTRVDVRIEAGTITGLIGPNGAGKTTLFNVITGNARPESGRVVFKGRDITRLKPERICPLGIARTYQQSRPFLGLSVLENVMVGVEFGRGARSRPGAATAEALRALEFVSLAARARDGADALGPRERKCLEIARALASEPDLLLLDEVMAGLTARETSQMMDIVGAVRDRGVTVIMIEHVMRAVMRLSDRVVVLHHGEKLAEGTPAQVSSDERVIQAYLGDGAGDAGRHA